MIGAGDPGNGADTGRTDGQSDGPASMARNGDVVMPVDQAEWWGSSLGILVAAFHHPHLLSTLRPDCDPGAVARDVLDQLDEIRTAADVAEAQQRPDSDRRRSVDIRREGDSVVISPGDEVHNLAWCLDVFARGVIDPSGRDAITARGATGYVASAWSGDIGRATGTLPAPGPQYLEPTELAFDGPDFGP